VLSALLGNIISLAMVYQVQCALGNLSLLDAALAVLVLDAALAVLVLDAALAVLVLDAVAVQVLDPVAVQVFVHYSYLPPNVEYKIF
jgi:hypothetical protein